MDPRQPLFFPEQSVEEPLEVPDYYEAMRKEWLAPDMDEAEQQAYISLDPQGNSGDSLVAIPAAVGVLLPRNPERS